MAGCSGIAGNGGEVPLRIDRRTRNHVHGEAVDVGSIRVVESVVRLRQ